jgi:phosphoribosylformylglycinamidine (FGAM) synthase PurS component
MIEIVRTGDYYELRLEKEKEAVQPKKTIPFGSV